MFSNFKSSQINPLVLYIIKVQLIISIIFIASIIGFAYLTTQFRPSFELLPWVIASAVSGFFCFISLTQFWWFNQVQKIILPNIEVNKIMARSLVFSLLSSVGYFIFLVGILNILTFTILCLLFYFYNTWLESLGKFD